MKVYVASKFENKEAVRRAHALLRAAGHEVTHDWTAEEESDDRRKYAMDDYLGAAFAHVTIVLSDYPPAYGPMKGALIECGIALGNARWVFYVGSSPVGTIFDALPRWRHFTTVEQAVAALGEVLP